MNMWRSGVDPLVLAERLKITPDPWQRAALRSTARRSLWVAHRQSGKSTIGALLALHQGLVKPGSLTLILADSLAHSKETFAKVVGLYRTMGRPLQTE